MKHFALILLAAASCVGACTKQARQTTYDKQTTYIESFISSRMKSDQTATLTVNGGSYRLTLNDTLDPTRDSLDYGGRVKFYYALYTLSSSSVSNSNLVATNKADVASGAGWSLSDESQFAVCERTLDNTLVEGLRLGLHGVQESDEAWILFTGKYGFENSQMGAIPALSALAYHVWIESIE